MSKKPSKALKNIGFIVFCSIWTIVVLFGVQLIIGYPMVWLLGADFNLPVWRGVYEVLVYTLSALLIIFIPMVIWRWLQKGKLNPFKLSKQELGIDKWPTFTDIALAPVGYIVHLVIASGLMALMSNFSWFDATQVQETGFSYFVRDFDRLIAIICIVFLAPLAEEFIMRGWLFGKIRARLGFISTALIVSLVFAFLHFQWNVAVTTFSLSLILCVLRETTGSIWSGVILHILQNGIAFYLLYSMI